MDIPRRGPDFWIKVGGQYPFSPSFFFFFLLSTLSFSHVVKEIIYLFCFFCFCPFLSPGSVSSAFVLGYPSGHCPGKEALTQGEKFPPKFFSPPTIRAVVSNGNIRRQDSLEFFLFKELASEKPHYCCPDRGEFCASELVSGVCSFSFIFKIGLDDSEGEELYAPSKGSALY